IVATDVGGTREVTGRAARPVPYPDADAMTTHITQLLTDPEQADQLRTAARHRAGELHSPAAALPQPLGLSAQLRPLEPVVISSDRTPGQQVNVPRHIFVTGGVASSLGKGLTASSLGHLLRARGLRVTMQKLDPYLNVDPGTMNPFQHGEVFVTEDGAET